jgi:hypothetical protein
MSATAGRTEWIAPGGCAAASIAGLMFYTRAFPAWAFFLDKIEKMRYNEGRKMKNKKHLHLGMRRAVLWLIGTVFVIGAGSWLVTKAAQAGPTPTVTARAYVQDTISGVQLRSTTTFEFMSDPIQTEAPVNAVGFIWSAPAEISFDVQYLSNEQWSDWFALTASTDIQPKDARQHATDLLFLEPTRTFRYRIHAATEPNDVTVIALSDGQPRTVAGLFQGIVHRLVPKAKAATTIISRAQWGANETISTWPAEYAAPKKFIIHHTVTSDGGADPAAVIRTIQYYHAVTLGWGDIGYNYLIDAAGRVYEGRKGGDAVIGAHAARDTACNQERFGGSGGINFNPGSVGIALLGNYQDNQPTQAAIDALTNFVAERSVLYGLPPAGTSDWLGMAALPNIIGHGDIDCTLCPGQYLTPLLAQIRTASQTLYDSGVIQAAPNVRLDSVNPAAFELERGQTKTVQAIVTNIGNTSWHSFDQPVLSIRPVASPAVMAATNWPEAGVAGRLTADAVAPGDSVAVEFTVTAPGDRLAADEEYLVAIGDQLFTGTKFNIHIDVTGLDRAARLAQKTVPVATLVKQRPKMILQYTNLGKITWTPLNTFLTIADLNNRPSRYGDRSWPSAAGKIKLKEARVATGQVGTFEFYETSPAVSGLYKQIFSLFTDNLTVINSTVELISRVDSIYRGELISDNVPVATRAGWRPTVTVKIKNTGVAAWDGSMRLKIYDLGGRVSPFRDPTWSTSAGEIRMNEKTVRSGETATFTFRLKPASVGLYLAEFRLAAAASPEPVACGAFARKIRVDPK